MKSVGLRVEYGREIEETKDMGSFKSVGDKEYVEIVSMYAEGMGYNMIAEKLGRSTRTPYTHVHRHNKAVKRSGFCVMCKRVGGEYEGEVVSRQ